LVDVSAWNTRGVSTSGPTQADGRQRRRGQALVDAILDAAHAELAENGWEGFTVDGVSVRSGAAKSVIYRRWRSRVDLAVGVLQRANLAAPHTLGAGGGLRTDLVDFLTGMAAFLRSPFGAAVRGIERDGDAANRFSIFEGEAHVAAVQKIVDRAIAAGELGGQPSALALNLGHSLVMTDFLHVHEPPSDDAIVELVDTVWIPALRQSERHT
jgi:AcrR family transcriptional regulator